MVHFALEFSFKIFCEYGPRCFRLHNMKTKLYFNLNINKTREIIKRRMLFLFKTALIKLAYYTQHMLTHRQNYG